MILFFEILSEISVSGPTGALFSEIVYTGFKRHSKVFAFSVKTFRTVFVKTCEPFLFKGGVGLNWRFR